MTEPFASDEQVPNEVAIRTVRRLLDTIDEQRKELLDMTNLANSYRAGCERLRNAHHAVRLLISTANIDIDSRRRICQEIDAALELLPFMGLTEDSNENPS